MKLKHKIALLVIGILLVVSLLVGSSYALWVFNVSQESTNVLVSDCFEITFTEGSQAIHLTNTFPMKDSKGVYTTPYEFTLRNICGQAADISINLETLNDSQIAGENLRVDVNGHIHTYGDENSVEPTLANATSAASFYEDTIAAGDSKDYVLRLWIKEDASNVDVINKSYSSKITIRSTLRKNYSEATLEKGESFIANIKQLSGTAYANFNIPNNNITSIRRSYVKPDESITKRNVSTSNSKPIYAWFDDGVIYLYSDYEKINLNKNSSYLFSYLNVLNDIDLTMFGWSNVTDMNGMFRFCSNLTSIDLSQIDTSKVTDMNGMFLYSGVQHLNLTNVDTSNVVNMNEMFNYMSNIENIDVSTFNTSKVTNMRVMFAHSQNITSLDLSSFDTSNVVNMNGMFEGIDSLKTIEFGSSFNTSKVTDMGGMFFGDYNLEKIDVSSFDTSNVTNMWAMFGETKKIKNLDLSNFNTSQVTDMTSMFTNMSSLVELDLSSFNTENVKTMAGMFSNTSNLQKLNISSFNTSNVTDMGGMFYLTNLSELDLSGFDTSSVTKTYSRFTISIGVFTQSGMFAGSRELKTIYVGNDWNMSSVTTSTNMFSNNFSIIGGAGTTYDENHIDVEYARVDDPTNGKPGYFILKTN